MNFLIAPAIVGTLIYGLYKILELYGRRRERIMMIEKFSVIDSSRFDLFKSKEDGFISLRMGAVLCGLGLGVVVGTFLSFVIPSIENYYSYIDLQETMIGSSTLLFGGLSLVVEFIIEKKIKKERKN